MHEKLKPLTPLELGIYEHYSGMRCNVIGLARHSETLEEMVVYEEGETEKNIWVRPRAMFLENVEVGDKKMPRFKYTGK